MLFYSHHNRSATIVKKARWNIILNELARPARTADSSGAADARHHARTTTHDDEKVLSAHKSEKPETPIDGVRQTAALGGLGLGIPVNTVGILVF